MTHTFVDSGIDPPAARPLTIATRGNSTSYVSGPRGVSSSTLTNLSQNLTGVYCPVTAQYDPVNGELYVIDAGGFIDPWAVTAVNPNTGRLISYIPAVSPPYGLRVDPMTGDVFLGSGGPGFLNMVINGSSNVPSFPTNLGASAQLNQVLTYDSSTGNFLYTSLPSLVENASTGNYSQGPAPLFLVNGTGFQNVTPGLPSLPGYVDGAAYDPYNHDFFVSSGWWEGNLTVLNGQNLTMVTNIPNLPLGHVLFNPINHFLYLAGVAPPTFNGSNDSGVLVVINPLTDRVVTRLSVGSLPAGLAFDPVNMNLYVANELSNSISIINTNTNRLIRTISLGSSPFGITYDSTTGSLFIPECNTSQLVELTPNYPRYPLTFSEQGLPAGVNWSVSIGAKTYYASGGTTIHILEFNGSHAFAVNDSLGWTPSPSSGTVQVGGVPQTVAVSFNVPYGSLQGSVQPSDAEIELDNQPLNVTATGNFTEAQLAPGPYLVRAEAPGFFGMSIAVSILPHNRTTLQIRLLPALAATGPQAWLVPWAVGLFGGLTILAGFIAVGAAVFYRKVRRTPPR